jgi:hypothetical protein
MVEAISDMRPMVSPISLMAPTDSCVAAWMPEICVRDLAGGLRGLLGQRLHFGGHDREAATGFAGTRRFDGRVERQQIGLARDVVDQLDDIADARCRAGEFADAIIGLARLIDRLPWRCWPTPAPDG